MIGPARFISLEGGEGAGKSTQAQALASALSERGVHTVVTREPGGSEGAEAVRALLLQGETARWSVRAEALLFAAARADHVERIIYPALAKGSWVISDRFVDSTRAYQGGTDGVDGVDDAAILALHAFGSRGLLPDRTFVLEIPPAEGERRATMRDGAGADRFARRDPSFHTAVAASFRAIATREPERMRLIDARRAPDVVTASIIAELVDLLP